MADTSNLKVSDVAVNLGIRTPRSSIRSSLVQPILGIERSDLRRKATGVYDQEEDLKKQKVFAEKNSSMNCGMLFSYTSGLDKILILLATVMTVISGVFIPYLNLQIGHIIRASIIDAHCNKTTDPELVNERNGIYSEVYFKDTTQRLLNEIFFMSLFTLAFMYTYSVIFGISADDQTHRIRVAYLEALLRKDFAWYDTFVEKDFSQHLTREISIIRVGIGERLPFLIFATSTVTCLVAFSVIMSWKFFLILVGTLPFSWLIFGLGLYAENEQMMDEINAYTRSNALSKKIMENMKTIRVYEGEKKEFEKYKESHNAMPCCWKWVLASSLITFFFWIIYYARSALAFYLGSLDVIDNCHHGMGIDVLFSNFIHGPEAMFVVFGNFVLMAILLSKFPYLIMNMTECQRKISDVIFLIEWRADIDNLFTKEGQKPHGKAIGRIEFISVSLRYPLRPNKYALRDINMIIYPGQLVGFIGAQSSGKSSLLNLMQRIYDPTEGQVYFDGRDMQRLNVIWLRENIRVVEENFALFSQDSIEENIRIAKRDATFSEITAACRKAGVHEDILKLQNDYETICSKSEMKDFNLIRKISIARALLSNPKILIFDETFLEIDPLEDFMLELIEKLRAELTIIITSSKFNNIVKVCDTIYVLEKGMVREKGDHESLLNEKGIYFRLVEGIAEAVLEQKPLFGSLFTTYKFGKTLERMHIHKSEYLKQESDLEYYNKSKFHEAKKYSPVITQFADTDKALKLLKWKDFFSNFQRFNILTKSIFMNSSNIRQLLTRETHSLINERYLFKSKLNSDKRLGFEKIIKSKKNKRKSIFSWRSDRETLGLSTKTARLKDNKDTNSTSSSQKVKKNSAGEVIDPNAGYTRKYYGWEQFISDENISICSEDEDLFWDDYSRRIDEIRENVRKAEWSDVLVLLNQGKLFAILGIIVSMLYGAMIPVFCIIIGDVYSAFIVNGSFVNTKKIEESCLNFMLLGCIVGFLSFLQGLVFGLGGLNLTKSLRLLLFKSILRQDMEWFDFPENDLGLLTNRLAIDCPSIRRIIFSYYGIIFQSLSTIFASIGIALSYTKFFYSTLYLVFFVVVGIIIATLYEELNEQLEAFIDPKLRKSFLFARDILQMNTFKTIISLNLAEQMLNEYKIVLKLDEKKMKWLTQILAILYASIHATPFIIFSFWLYVGGKVIFEEKGEFREFFIISLLLIISLGPICEALAFLPDCGLSREAAYRIVRIIHSHPDIVDFDRENKRKYYYNEFRNIDQVLNNPEQRPPHISMNGIEFQYEIDLIDKCDLKNINFEIPSGSFTAIVGHSHSGKTALVGIIMRLLRITNGYMNFDGVDVEKIHLATIRRIMALVEQDPGLFKNTIRENLEYGDNSRKVRHKELISACDEAKIHTYISRLPKGYYSNLETLLEERSSFNFDIMQKLSLARALIHNPKVLVVHNANALFHNDENEESVAKKIELLRGWGRTLIIATERIDFIRRADNIIVIKDGTILEQGTDTDLLKKEGHYHKMYTTQRVVEISAQLTHSPEGPEDHSNHKKLNLDYERYYNFFQKIRERKYGSGNSENSEEWDDIDSILHGDLTYRTNSASSIEPGPIS